MSSQKQPSHACSLHIGRLLLTCMSMIVTAAAQVNQSQAPQSNPPATDKVTEALNALRSGNLAESNVYLLVKAGATQAIPDLKKQFALAEDNANRAKLASALIRLGDKDATWWDYLAQKGEEAVNSDAPSVVDYDSNGKMIPGVSPKFATWAKVHSLTVDAALKRTELDLAAVVFIGESMDRRGIPLLRQALLSSNYLVEMAAARGLAQFQDSASIPSSLRDSAI